MVDKEKDEFEQLEAVQKKFAIVNKIFLRMNLKKMMDEYIATHGGIHICSESKFINLCVERFFEKEDEKQGGLGGKNGKLLHYNTDILEELFTRELIISNIITKMSSISNEDKTRIISEGEKIASENLERMKKENRITNEE